MFLCSFFGHKEVVQWLCYREEIDLQIKGPLDGRNRVGARYVNPINS